MTKKDKQPRDGNGKFASSKPIALYDTNGNVAYFTKEELAGLKNPDCEPATKEYVKCLMRKTREHTHTIYWNGVPTGLGALCGWFLLMFCLMDKITSDGHLFANQYAGLILVFTIIMSCVFYEFTTLRSEGIENFLPSDLKKYTPPACEKKEECE